jgi:hypothetical protein
MARILRDSGVLNQFGSPSLNSNTLANRPAFGQPGRLFVSTDTLAIFRDTGTAWDNLTDNPGNIGTLQEVTTQGNTTTLGIFAGASGSLTAGRLLEVKGKSLLTDTSGNVLFIGLPSVTPNNSTLDVYGYTTIRNTVDTSANLGPLLYAQYSLNYSGIQLSGFANSIFAQDVYLVSANTTVASSTQSGTSLNINTYKFSTASTITFTQPAGTIRAASALTAYSQFENSAAGTITHAAGITILGVENIGGSALNITNNYQLLINASDEFASTATFTPANQYGIYQAGVNDKNFFRGIIQQGNTSAAWISLENNSILGRFGAGLNDFFIQCFSLTFLTNTSYTKIFSDGSFVIGSNIVNTTRKLQVNGEQEWITPTATGSHTTSGNHLPIWVNGVKYWLALLSPVIP